MNGRLMKIAGRALPALLCAAWGCASLGGQGGSKQAGPGAPAWVAQVTITRDEWGVPYIDAESDAAASFGLAYAMAEDGYYELEEAYARALGMAAAYYGESMLSSDLLRLQLQTNAGARRAFAAEPAAAVRSYEAFAEGLNYFMRRHPGLPPRHITRYEGWMVLALENDVAVVQPIELALRNRTLPPLARASWNAADDGLAWIARSSTGRWDPLESTCRHASLSIL